MRTTGGEDNAVSVKPSIRNSPFRQTLRVGVLAVALMMTRCGFAQGQISVTNRVIWDSVGNFFLFTNSPVGITNLLTAGWNNLPSEYSNTLFAITLTDFLSSHSNLVAFPSSPSVAGSSALSQLFGTNIHIIAWNNASSTANFPGSFGWFWQPISVPVSEPPTNDNFANAIELFGTSASASSVNTLATGEAGEPQHIPGIPAAHSSWWHWTPSYTAQTVVTLNSYSGTLAVYRDEVQATLERVAAVTTSDYGYINWPLIQPYGYPQILPYSQSTTSFLAEAGMTYYFAGESSSTVSWTLDQQVLSFAPPAPLHGTVGVPIELQTVSLETNSGPLTVDFMLGSYGWLPSFPVQPLTSLAPEQIGWIQPYPYPITPRLIAQLGTVTTPPYRTFWTPTNVGTFFLWARSTNSAGEIHETPQSPINIYPENDDFAHATLISPSTARTNFAFGSSWSSVETNEPRHAFGPAANTLWWKWTPSYSGNVRLKAVRNLYGMPLEVFTGSSLRNLRLVANNSPKLISIPGVSGIVKLRVKAGQTYYIRTDNDTRRLRRTSSFPPYDIPLDSLLTIEPVNTPLPGELNFNLIAGSYTSRNGHQTIVPIARVYQTDGRTPLAGSQYRAQLYVGSNSRTLAPAGDPQTFLIFDPSGMSSSYGGLFFPAPVFLPDTVPHQLVFAQIRVWDSSFGDSYEVAKANGSPFGTSNIIPVRTGSEETGGALLLGIRNFSLHPGITP